MTQHSTNTPAPTRDEMVFAAKKKLKTFRAKQAQSSLSSCSSLPRRRSHSRGSSISSTTESLPSSVAVATDVTRNIHQKRRSHSRTASILKPDIDSSARLSPVTASFPRSPAKPANLGDLNRSFSFGGSTLVAPVMTTPPAPTSPTCSQQSTPRPRPSSHHRRRSSVSTRRESADMMGFDPASLSALKALGENDKEDVAKVRERALLSLEGKAPKPKARTVPELVAPMGFSKVEIPEWKTPDVERTFDWNMVGNKPKPMPFSLSNSMAGKRDSFGKNLVPSASAKGELAVLVEEEEEEDNTEDNKENVATVEAQVVECTPEPMVAPLVSSPTTSQSVRAASPSPSRPRPASLNLKAAALASSTAVVALPTPTPTPSPTPGPRPGMKPLNLGNPSYTARRQSMIALGSTSKRSSIPSRRQSLRSQSRDSGSTHSSRDSLGLNTANRFPPTPSTMSPTSMYSAAAGVEGFLQKNQEVLISRIDQLEKALAKSRRTSLQSDTSISSSIAEEQIGLIADLKTERNALVEEIAGWRTRVEDLERQAALYANRIESERDESTIARARVQELEAERAAWESDRAAYNETIARAREDAESWRSKYEEAAMGECHWQAQAIGLESDVKRLERELAAASNKQRWNMALAPRRFDGSVSSASTTDVEDAMSDADLWKIRPRAPSPVLNMDVVVEEEEEDIYEDSYEQPSLNEDEEYEPRFIEEDEDDVDNDMLDEVNGDLCVSYSADSFDSTEGSQTESQSSPTRGELSHNFQFPGSFPPSTPTQGHARTGSMVKGWQMPLGPAAPRANSPTKPDRFFDQLEHLYSMDEDDLTPPTTLNFGSEPVKFGSPEFNTFKGDGGAGAFTFGSKRNSVTTNFRGHGTRASRASISLAAFNGLGMPPFMNPEPEWIVKDSPAIGATDEEKPGSDALQGQTSSAGEPLPCPHESNPASGIVPPLHVLADADRTPTMAKPPRFIAAPTSRPPTGQVSSTRTSSSSSSSTPYARITTTSSSTSHRALVVRRNPSLTRAQPTGRAPPRVPVDTSHDISRSPFSFSYSRTSSRSSGSRNSIVGQEAAAIEEAIAQAQAALAAQQSRRLTFTGLTSLLPWGVISGGTTAKSTVNAPLCVVAEGGEEEQRLLAPRRGNESGTVTREAQLERLRRELRVAGRPVVGVSVSGPCCSRCKTDVIQL